MSDEHHDGRAHALLGPSAAERWTVCPASVLLAEDIEDEGSVYAEEGSAFHDLAELVARWVLIDGFEVEDVDLGQEIVAWSERWPAHADKYDEMWPLALEYVELLRGKLAEHEGSRLMLEVRVQTGIPECWGTADAVIIWPGGIEVVDIKYGSGVRVEVHRNPQLRLYAVGALMMALLLADVELVWYTVWQPRMSNHASEEMTATDLLAWRDSLLPVAAEALLPGARFGPSEDSCRWCPVRGRCDAQMEWATSVDFGRGPGLLTPEQQADALDMLPGVKDWVKAVEDAALDDIYSKGKAIPRWKVVMSGGIRKVEDPDGAVAHLRELGYDEDRFMKPPVERTIRGIGDLEKLVGKADFDEVLGAYVKKGEGKPALAHEDDGRPSVDPDTEAAKEFDS